MKHTQMPQGSFDWAVPYDDPSPLDHIIQQELNEQIRTLLKILTSYETQIITLYFGLNNEDSHSDAVIGEMFYTTRERIRQTREKALQKLRHPSRANLLNSYL